MSDQPREFWVVEYFPIGGHRDAGQQQGRSIFIMEHEESARKLVKGLERWKPNVFKVREVRDE